MVAVVTNTPGILSKISQALSLHNYKIEPISSLGLVYSIVIVCLVKANQDINSIKQHLKNIVGKYDMKLIVDHTSGNKYKFIKSDAFLRIQEHHEAWYQSLYHLRTN